MVYSENCSLKHLELPTLGVPEIVVLLSEREECQICGRAQFQ